MHSRYASVDVGSTATRFLIREIPKGELVYDPAPARPADYSARFPIPVGESVALTGYISTNLQQQLLACFRQIRLCMLARQVDRYRAVATASFRNATNGAAVVNEIEAKTGIHVEIISGIEEARLSLYSYLAQSESDGKAVLLVDVGGLSTDVSMQSPGTTQPSTWSFNVGTLRPLTSPQYANTVDEISQTIEQAIHKNPNLRLIGTGGSIHYLARLWGDRRSLRENTGEILTLTACNKAITQTTPLSVEQRMHSFGLSRLRARTIMHGASIYKRILESARRPYIEAPDIGVRHGIICQLMHHAPL